MTNKISHYKLTEGRIERRLAYCDGCYITKAQMRTINFRKNGKTVRIGFIFADGMVEVKLNGKDTLIVTTKGKLI